jgi:hypothetical protein
LQNFIQCRPVTDNVNASLVGRVQLEDGLLEGWTEKVSCETEDGRRFADTRRTCDDDVGHITVSGKDSQARDGVLVANDFLMEIIETKIYTIFKWS